METISIMDYWYWVIPNLVLFDKRLNDKQKLLFCLISSLCAEKWYCRASNEYLWERLWVWKQCISNNIKELSDLWYLNLEIIKNYDRKISISYNINYKGDIIKIIGGYNKNYRGDIKKIIYNNINNNNINNNINNNVENQISLLSVNVEEEKEKNSAKKEKEVVYNEYDFVDEFIDKNNWTIQYLLNKDKDYIKKQSRYVDKLVKQWYDIETIKTVLNFIKQDDFWRKNILSVEKLLRKNKDWVPYIVVMIEKIKQYRPKAIDLDSLYINNYRWMI